MQSNNNKLNYIDKAGGRGYVTTMIFQLAILKMNFPYIACQDCPNCAPSLSLTEFYSVKGDRAN